MSSLYKATEFRPNTLYSNDCLQVLRAWQPGCVDLIYLDPPFNSNANYNVIFDKDSTGADTDEKAQFVAFEDTWNWDKGNTIARMETIAGDTNHRAHNSISGIHRIIGDCGMMAYLSYMAERLAEMWHILKNNGSIYLHCDPTASHYLKIVMDEVFGKENFRNEIVWHYPNRLSQKGFPFPKMHDIILLYSKSDDFVRQEILNPDWVPSKAQERRVAKGWEFYKKQLIVYDEEKALAAGHDLQTMDWKKGKTGRKRVNSVWVMDALSSTAKERLGYPTQKPVKLLKRIVTASSYPGALVLDPFCGCGTTAAASYLLKRQFIGIDISPFAIKKVCGERLKNAAGVQIRGLPENIKEAADMNPFAYEHWVLTLMQGFKPNEKQVGDGGVDGRATLLTNPAGERGRIIAQVKQGKFTSADQRALLSIIAGGKASVGVFVTLHKVPDTNRTKQEVLRAAGHYKLPGGDKRYPRIIYWSVEEYFAGRELPLAERVPTRAERQMDVIKHGG